MLEAHASGQPGLLGSLRFVGAAAASGRSAAAAAPAAASGSSARVAPSLATRPDSGDELRLLALRLHNGDC
ncbi:MAG: hypothetical protein ACK559_06210, partial [bacterium]